MGEATKCPKCDEPTDCDSVDVGVGIIYGPSYCPSCGWSEYADAGKVIDGYYHDIDGSAYRVDAVVEKCERFGLGEAAREAFDAAEKRSGP